MSSNVDVPYTRRNVSVLSQRSKASGQRQRTPRPIDESMVRERLSANLPDSFHYLSNTLPMGPRQRRHHHRHHDRTSSSSSSSGSSRSRSNDAENADAAANMNRSTGSAPAQQNSRPGAFVGPDVRPRPHRASGSRSSSRHSHRSSRSSSSSSSTASSNSSREAEEDGGSYNFHARLVKLDCSDPHGGNAGRMHSPLSTAAAAAAPASPTGGTTLVAQCCDTVRDTVDLLDQLRLATNENSDPSEPHDTFFWLDLHGVPPPLPGSPAWGSRSRAWRKRQHAELRRSVQEDTARGTGRRPEVELSALWRALGLQPEAMQTLNNVCDLRQRAPRPDRTSLDDVYEEEMVDLAYPDDRILHVDMMAGAGAAGREGNGSGDAAEPMQRCPTSREDPPDSPKASARVVQGHALTPQTSFVVPHGAPTHYVLMELSTLLTSVPAATTNNGIGAWSSTFLSTPGAHDYANEPLNDQVWAETLGRSMHTFPAHYRAAAAAASAAAQRRTHGGANSRQVTLASLGQSELPATPLITSTYVICFPGGCVTWCPGSTLGLISAARRERRAAVAQQRRQKHQEQRQLRRRNSQAPHSGGSPLLTPTGAGRRSHMEDRSSDATTDSDDSTASDVDDGLAVQYVKSWEQLQASVFHRLRHMSASQHHSNNNHNDHYHCGDGVTDAAGGAPPLCTSGFVSLLLSAVCYAYLPNTTSVLGEVDAIDSMLPLVGLNVESDQADALRRVLLLRRRLAVHRRLLFQKIRLLEALDKPAMHTVARFVRTVKVPSWVQRAAKASAQGSSSGGGGVGGSPRALITRSSEGHRRDSDTDSLSAAPTPHLLNHTETAPHFGGAAAGVGGGGSGGGGAQPIVHFLDTSEEPPWSRTTAEQNYGGRSVNGGSKSASTTCFMGADGDHRTGSRAATAFGGRPLARMAEPPSLNAIHKGIANVLRNLEVARAVLGNTTLIYCSTVNYNNSRSSESSDYFALISQYMLLIVLPLSIVASHWGMNCAVPFKDVKGTTPFWSIVGVMIFFGVAGLAVPIYAYRTGKMNMIS